MTRSLLAMLLSLSLVMDGSAAHADATDAANEIVQTSYAVAQRVAQDLFRYYLISGLMENLKQSEGLDRIARALSEVRNDIEKYRRLAQELFLSSEFAEEIAGDENAGHSQFIGHLRRSIEAYDNALLEIRRNSYNLNAGESTAIATKQKFTEILNHVRETCRAGVSAQFLIPNLPPITIRPPGFSMGFNYQVNGTGGDLKSEMGVSGYFSPDMAQFWGHDAGAYSAAGFALTELGFYYLINAFPAIAPGAAGTAGATTSTVAWASVYAIVVWIIIFIVVDAIERSKATDQANAVEHAIRDRADADSVAVYYRAICNSTAKPLLEAEDEFSQLSAASKDSSVYRKFQADMKEVSDQTIKLIGHAKELDELRKKLEAQGISGEALESAVANSPERQHLTDFLLKEIGLDGLIKIFRVQLLNLAGNSDLAITSIRKLKRLDIDQPENQVESVTAQLSSQRQRLSKLYQIAYEQSLELQFPGTVAAFKNEIAVDKFVTQFYRRWLDLYSRYLIAVFNGRPRDSLQIEMLSFYGEVSTVALTHPSETLSLIERRLNYFLKVR